MVGSITDLSTIDYPGLPAMVLFFKACNLKCAYCHNMLLARDPNMIDNITYPEVRRRMREQANLVQAVVFSGGEPCMTGKHERASSRVPSIHSLMREARELKLKVKLDTNGTYPEELSHMISMSGVDYVALDIKTYPCLTNDHYYAPYRRRDWSSILTTLDVLESARRYPRNNGFKYEVRTTCYPRNIHSNSIRAIAQLLPAEVPYFLQQYEPIGTRGPTPYSETAMQGFLRTAQEYHPNTYIRGEQNGANERTE